MTTMTICDACGAHVSSLQSSEAKSWVTLKMQTVTSGHTIHNHHLCPTCYQKAVTWLEKGRSLLQRSSQPSEL